MELFNILAKASMRLSAPLTQEFIEVEYRVVDAFDAIVLERGGLVATPANNTMTVNATARYKLRVGLNFEARASEELQIVPYVNGVAYSSNPISIQATGVGKPVEAFWESDINLTAGDVVDIRGRNGDGGTVDIDFTRSTFALTKDS